MTKEQLYADYLKTAQTLNFMFGGICGNEIKFIFTTADTVFSTCTVQETSSKYGKSAALRVHFSGTVKKEVQKNGFTLCTLSEFQYLLENPIDGKNWNRGELFEYLIFRHFGISEKWRRTNGIHSIDIIVNDIPYQIKTDRGWLK